MTVLEYAGPAHVHPGVCGVVLDEHDKEFAVLDQVIGNLVGVNFGAETGVRCELRIRVEVVSVTRFVEIGNGQRVARTEAMT